MKLNKLAAAVALVAASAGANAAWDTNGNNVQQGDFFSGELLFVAYNASTDPSDGNRYETYYQDLGTATGFTFDFPDAGLTAGSPQSLTFFVGNSFSNMSGDNLRWTVLGRTALDGGGFANNLFGSNGSPDPAAIQVAPLDGYPASSGLLAAVNSDANYGANEDQYFNISTKDAQESSINIANLNSSVGFDVTAAIGEDLTFSGMSDFGQLNEYGTWSFDGNKIEFSAIPVPAAAWLFGSALLGLAGAARRRKA